MPIYNSWRMPETHFGNARMILFFVRKFQGEDLGVWFHDHPRSNPERFGLGLDS